MVLSASSKSALTESRFRGSPSGRPRSELMSCVFRLSILAAFLVAAAFFACAAGDSAQGQSGRRRENSRSACATLSTTRPSPASSRWSRRATTSSNSTPRAWPTSKPARPMRKDTIFQIMSMTKPVTAIAIMMLAEEGKLSVRDPVEQYLPEFKNLRVATNTGPDADTTRRSRARHHHPRPAHPHRRIHRRSARRDQGLPAPR